MSPWVCIRIVLYYYVCTMVWITMAWSGPYCGSKYLLCSNLVLVLGNARGEACPSPSPLAFLLLPHPHVFEALAPRRRTLQALTGFTHPAILATGGTLSALLPPASLSNQDTYDTHFQLTSLAETSQRLAVIRQTGTLAP